MVENIVVEIKGKMIFVVALALFDFSILGKVMKYLDFPYGITFEPCGSTTAMK